MNLPSKTFVLIAAVSGLWPEFASADIITLDFESGSYSSIFNADDLYVQDGFTVRPMADGNHSDCGSSIAPEIPYYCFHNGLGGNLANIDNDIEIKFSGKSFDILSIDFLGRFTGSGTDDETFFGIDFISSAGDVLNVTSPGVIHLGWTNITSFVMSIPMPQRFSELMAIDNVVVRVPEPGTFALFGIGLAGMGLARRRKQLA